jgi:hypothetical protein
MRTKWQVKTAEAKRNANIGKWHDHVATKISINECIECEQKPIKGQQRCKECAALNRAKCMVWGQKNGKTRYKLYKKAGFCYSCRNTRDRTNGTYCKECCSKNRVGAV